MGRHPVAPDLLEKIARFSDTHSWDDTAREFHVAKTTVQKALLEFPPDKEHTLSVGMQCAIRQNFVTIKATPGYKKSVPANIRKMIDWIEDLICNL